MTYGTISKHIVTLGGQPPGEPFWYRGGRFEGDTFVPGPHVFLIPCPKRHEASFSRALLEMPGTMMAAEHRCDCGWRVHVHRAGDGISFRIDPPGFA